MEVQWLELRTFTAKGLGLISGPGTKIPYKSHGAAKNLNRHFEKNTFKKDYGTYKMIDI